jgi:hypothetical protein
MMASIVSFECADFRDTRLIKIAFWPHPERRLDEIVRRGHLARPSFSVAILRHGSVGLANLVTPTARSSGRVGAGMFSLTPRLPLCSCFVRDRPIARANHGRRSAPGQHTPAPSPRPRSQPRPQTDRLRQTPRRHGSASRHHPRLRPPRQTLRHRRSRRHHRPHHQWPAARRSPGSHARPARDTRPGPHAFAHPRTRRTQPTSRSAVSTAGRPARQPRRGPPPRPPAHGGRDRRRGASPTDRRRHRRYLP